MGGTEGKEEGQESIDCLLWTLGEIEQSLGGRQACEGPGTWGAQHRISVHLSFLRSRELGPGNLPESQHW